MDKVNRYIALSRKDVSKGVERKGNLDYLSWGYRLERWSRSTPTARTTSVSLSRSQTGA